MKKKISFIIGIIGAIVIECAIAAAIIISKHPLYYLDYEIRDDYAVVTDCKDNVKKVDIPEEIEGYPVVKIGAYAFEDCNVEVINIPDSVKEILTCTFYNCKRLREINLPESIEYIGYEAFENCSSIKEIIIPDSAEIIEFKAFANCTSLKKAVLPDNENTIVFGNTFLNCTSLSEIIISDKIFNFSAADFKGCENLKSWTITDTNPHFVKYNDAIYTKDFKKLVFYSATAGFLDLHPETEIIGKCAFSANNKLTNIVIPENIKKIEFAAFFNSQNLRTVKFENGLTEIESQAFTYCPDLNEVILPDTLETIGEDVFLACDNLKKITIPASVKEIGKDAVGYTTEIEDYFVGGNRWRNFENMIIKGYKNTVAEKYAKENDIEFIALN